MNKQDVIAIYKQKLEDNGKEFNRDYSQLMQYLLTSSFFDDPASMRFHNNFPGGLALHVLNFENALTQLLANLLNGPLGIKISTGDKFDPFIVAIGHDLNKVGSYRLNSRNTKINGQWTNLQNYDYGNNRDCFPHAMVSMRRIHNLVPTLLS